jgi:hypothetical protein
VISNRIITYFSKTMLIEVQRTPGSLTCTLGKLYIDSVEYCYTLEDIVREVKVYGETAIPAGVYRVVITHSNRFGCDMPLLLNVPGFEGVRIHPGNTDADTHGCILVGTHVGADGESISDSRAAYHRIFTKIRDAIDAGEEVQIELRD